MKKWTLLVSLAVLAGVTFAVAPRLAADQHEMSGTEMTDEQKAEMEAWAKLGQPGEVHREMAKFTGTFDTKATMWMAPGAPPSESTGKSENKMILGGRYLMEKYTGEMMGQPFEGFGLTAYDNAGKKFVSIWCDNMSTALMTMTGTGDWAEGVTLTGTVADPQTGKNIMMKSINTMKDENTFVLEMYRQDPGGKEFKTMEVTYSRSGTSAQKAGY